GGAGSAARNERGDERDTPDRVRRHNAYLIGACERERTCPEPSVPDDLLRSGLQRRVAQGREHDPGTRLDGGSHLCRMRELEVRSDDRGRGRAEMRIGRRYVQAAERVVEQE